jgi:FKBP-type peptidyl-prolyl cis-trans isomerase
MKYINLKSLQFLGLALALTASYTRAQTPPPQPAAPPSPDQMSYLLGVTFGSQMKTVGLGEQVSMEAMTRGLKDGLNGKTPTPEQQRALQAYVAGLQQAATAKNAEAAKEFLAKNAKEKGVTATASGLQYKVVNAGNKQAPKVNMTDTVSVNYRGTLLNGTEFDSSYTSGRPATFPVNGVINGWQEALQLMKPGAKYTLWIPPELGYGDRPNGKIPANSLLTFEVELLEVKASAAPAVPPGTPNK